MIKGIFVKTISRIYYMSCILSAIFKGLGGGLVAIAIVLGLVLVVGVPLNFIL